MKANHWQRHLLARNAISRTDCKGCAEARWPKSKNGRGQQRWPTANPLHVLRHRFSELQAQPWVPRTCPNLHAIAGTSQNSAVRPCCELELLRARTPKEEKSSISMVEQIKAKPTHGNFATLSCGHFSSRPTKRHTPANERGPAHSNWRCHPADFIFGRVDLQLSRKNPIGSMMQPHKNI